MENKEDVKKILERFRRVIKINFEILDVDSSQRVYGNYNGENPDFIIKLNNSYIGVELFKLRLNKSRPLIEYTGKSYVNQEHRNSERPNTFTISEAEKQLENIAKDPNQYPLHIQDDIYDVVKERLSEKFVRVLHNYITNINWLIGYANEINDQVRMVADINPEVMRNYIKKLLNVHNKELDLKINNIFLFELDTSSLEYIFNYKPIG